jgi:hypothetical protein
MPVADVQVARESRRGASLGQRQQQRQGRAISMLSPPGTPCVLMGRPVPRSSAARHHRAGVRRHPSEALSGNLFSILAPSPAFLRSRDGGEGNVRQLRGPQLRAVWRAGGPWPACSGPKAPDSQCAAGARWVPMVRCARLSDGPLTASGMHACTGRRSPGRGATDSRRPSVHAAACRAACRWDKA